MSLETGNFIDDLVITNPVSATDLVRFGAGHLRLIKSAVQNAFAGSGGAILVAGSDAGTVNEITLAPVPALLEYTNRMLVVWRQNVTNTGAARINISSLGAKPVVSIANAALTSGDLVAGRVYVGIYDGTSVQLNAVTKNYVDQMAFVTALPGQAGAGNALLVTDGTNASWAAAQAGKSGKFLRTNGTNISWEYAGISIVGATVTGNYTITDTTPTIWPCATTALGKCLTAPAITTNTALGLFAIIDNSAGGYSVGWHDSTGALVGKNCVAPGGIAHVYLEDNSTAAGVWRITGSNLEPGLITQDYTFSSTYSSTVLAPFVALDDSTSIHFVGLVAGGFAAFIDDKNASAPTTPVTVDAGASMAPVQCFKIDSTHAIVFYGASTTSHSAVVLTLTGASPSFSLSIGAVANIAVTMGYGTWGGENFKDAPKIVQLTTTLYVASYVDGPTVTNTLVRAISVAGTAVTIGASASIIASNSVITATYALTAATALVLYLSGASPYQLNAVVVSVAGATCTLGVPSSVVGYTTSTAAPSSCLLSSAKALIATYSGGTYVVTATVSGTTVTLSAPVNTVFPATGGMDYTSASATRYNPHLFPLSPSTALMWGLDLSGISMCCVLSEGGGTVTAGAILYRSFSTAASGSTGYGTILAQGTADFMAAVQTGATGAWRNSFVPHKISGTTITYGSSAQANELGPVSVASALPTVRLTSGDYVTMGANALALPVLRSNGDAINKRGSAAIPNLTAPTTYPIAGVSSNRIVLLGTTQGTTVAAGGSQLRILNIEVAQ